MLNIPNLLTLTRIFAMPVLILAYYAFPTDGHQVAAVIFALAAITDWLDGYLARRLQVVSAFGTLLDPIADKLMVCAALILLVADFHVTSKVYSETMFTLAVVVIVGREVSVAALREWMAEVGGKSSVAVTLLSKGKTALQMFAITFLLYEQVLYGYSMLIVGEVLLYIATLITIWTMIVYLRIAWPKFESDNHKVD